MGEDPVGRMCNVFSAINDRYEKLMMESGWTHDIGVQALYREFKGALVDGVSPEELLAMKEEVLFVWEKRNHMMAQQMREGYRPRTLDVVYSLVCWEAVIRMMGVPDGT